MRIADFYHFMHKREQIRLAKDRGDKYPWSDDKILSTYKFTNVKRVHDRTTRELRDQFYEGNYQASTFAQVLINAGIARYFGTSEFAIAAGWHTEYGPQQRKRLVELAADRMRNKERVFTGAYVITNMGKKEPKEYLVAEVFLKNLWDYAETISILVKEFNSWEMVIDKMRQIEGFGGTGFMAKEVLLDTIMLPGVWPEGGPADRNRWCPCGPGARRGAARVRGIDDGSGLNESETLRIMVSLFNQRENYWPLDMVELELHDIQFQLCEFDKYERVRLGQGKPRSTYKPR